MPIIGPKSTIKDFGSVQFSFILLYVPVQMTMTCNISEIQEFRRYEKKMENVPVNKIIKKGDRNIEVQ